MNDKGGIYQILNPETGPNFCILIPLQISNGILKAGLSQNNEAPSVSYLLKMSSCGRVGNGDWGDGHFPIQNFNQANKANTTVFEYRKDQMSFSTFHVICVIYLINVMYFVESNCLRAQLI